jgi:hypothetical protein
VRCVLCSQEATRSRDDRWRVTVSACDSGPCFDTETAKDEAQATWRARFGTGGYTLEAELRLERFIMEAIIGAVREMHGVAIDWTQPVEGWVLW